ncbi:Ferric reductase transmembrane component 5 [Mycena venus]|uniref:Ferric reductase transmembrane component 5 n=1 Tax=Mycena venus TaxID=2733690 RepID=A0A8H6YSR9_9AGAR|nr:Ferric reductase transmembrane component 5 [Mycena venus]
MSANGTAAGTTGAAPGAAAPPGGPAPAGARLDVGVLVYHTVIVLVALVALVVSLRLPRAFARLWRVSEWTRGHFLGYAAYAGPSQFPYTGSAASTTIDLSHGVGSSQDSHTYEAKFDVSSRTETPGSYPPRVESTPSFLRTVVSVLRSRVAPGFSAAQMAICAGWLGVLLYPTIYRSAGPFTDINRYGFIAISQVPFIFALGTKNNVVGIFLGMGYEKLNFLHRFVARLAIISAHLHGLGYIYKWCLANNFMQEIAQPKNYFGLVLLLSFDCILLTSLAFVRKNAYSFFFYSHIVFLHTVLICGFNHYPQLTPYLFATGAIYGLDKLMRMAKTRVKTATIRPIPQLGVTRIEIPDLNKGVHPFTIASESNSKEGLVLMCKKTGTWTHKLFAAALKSQAEWDVGRNIRVVVEGPYGGPGFTMFDSFSAAMFIVGGGGITFALSVIQELIQQDSRGESRVRVIELIWIVQDASSLMPLIPQFSAMIHQSTNTRLTISVHYTKAVVGKIRFTGLQPGITLTPGRPGLIAAIEGTVSYTASIGGGNAGVHSGLIVGVCGPVALADDVSKAVGLVDPAKRDEIGGIEIHEE